MATSGKPVHVSLDTLREIYHMPLLELVFRAASVHREFHDPRDVQVCTLLSIKTGQCPENCCYCAQSAMYETKVQKESLINLEKVMNAAEQAKANGSTRLCMGAAWRRVRDDRDFDRVLEMTKKVSDLGLEVCATLGMLTEEQAKKLAAAGLHAYNHNLDTSEEYYPNVVTTHTYSDRLETLKNARKAKLTLCSGGIIGLGECEEDRLRMIHVLANLDPPPESVPINALVPIEGTPLAERPRVSVWEMVRMVATARIAMPRSMVRLSAGRQEMSDLEQAFCFLAGANSIFAGDKLLTTPNREVNADQALFELLGLRPMKKREKHDEAPA